MKSLTKTKKTYLLLLLLIGLSQSIISQTYSTGTVNLSSTSGLEMTVKIEVSNEVKITLTGPTGRWFSLGFNASSMVSGTDVVSVHSVGNLNAFDCSLTGFSAPVVDASQNWTIISDLVAGSVRTVIATRALNTGEINDYIFNASPSTISLIWARSSSATYTYGYHGGSNRGIVSANLALVTPPTAPTGSSSQTFCSGATTTQLNASGTLIQWYASSSGGTALSNSTLVNGTTYYATQTVNGIESTNRLAVTVVINTIPAAPTSIIGSTNFCLTNSQLQYSVSPISNATSYVWTLPNGATGSSTSNSINVLFNSNFQTGNLTVQSQNTCGSSNSTALNLTQHFPSSNTINVSTCVPYEFNGQIYSQSGTYQYTGINVWGCDSIVTLNLVLNSSINETLNIETCGSYIWNGQTFQTNGVYVDTFQTSDGCDSIVTLNLILNSNINETLNIESCGSYNWNGQTFQSNGVYIDTFQTNNGCDSIVTLNLVVNPIFSLEIDTTVNNSFEWNGIVYDTSGSYTQNFNSSNSCDSTVTVNLIVTTVGLESLQNNFTYFPNPVGKERILYLPQNLIICDYYLFDFKGMLVQKGIVQNTLELNNNIEAGTYILNIQNKKLLILIE